MPIYAYKCDSCGFAKDVLQKMSAPLLSHCPVCGAATFKKQLTAAGFQLKGSGCYATDFKGAAAVAAATGASTETASVVADSAKPAASPVTKSDAATASAAGSGGASGSACACH